jgi:hypothetical protein
MLTLTFLSKYAFHPDLLILAAVTRKINIEYWDRWNHQRSDQTDIPFSSLAKMISAINAAGSLQFKKKFCRPQARDLDSDGRRTAVFRH